MHSFDETVLSRRLASLPAVLRVIFAAACAERLALACRLSRGQDANAQMVDRALEGVWLHPDPSEDPKRREAEIEQVMATIPQDGGHEDRVWDQTTTNAQNAGMAVIYVLRTRLTGSPQEAAWAARVAYEALDSFVINRDGIDTNRPGEEARVLTHPLLQAELARQQADLEELETISSGTQDAVREHLHARARADATRFFMSH